MSANEPQLSPSDGAIACGLLPSTPVQERCWFLNQLQPGITALTIPLCLELRGHAPSLLVEQALQAVVDRHEALRTRLVALDGAPMQQPLSDVAFKLTIVNLQKLDRAERRLERAEEILRSETMAPFNLGEAPLLRATMIQMTEESALLLVCAHQAVFDGSSIRIFARDLGESIAALKSGVAPALPDLPIQYADYALWLRDVFATADFSVEEAYWRRQLGDAPYFEVPADKPRTSPRSTDNGESISIRLDPALGKAFDAAPRALGCSQFCFGSAVTAATLGRFTNQTDIVLGTQLAGRDEADLENLIGAFINNLALRLDASGDPRFTDFLHRTASTLSDAVAHQRLPFHQLVATLNPPRDLSRTPIISATVQVQRAFFESERFGDIEITAKPAPMAGVFYDLAFFIIGRSDGWELTLEYNADVYRRETAEALVNLWRAMLEAVVADPATSFSALPKPERAALAANRTAPDLKTLIEAHPRVGECFIDTRGGSAFAYVTPAADSFEAIDDLPRALRLHLEAVAAANDLLAGISVVLSLPRGANGEVDRSRLPAPRRFEPEVSAANPVALANLEQRLGQIWTAVLKIPAADSNSHFFDLGGHSMSAVQMLARVRDELGLKIDPSCLFKHPTLRGFAAQVLDGVTPESDWRILRLETRGTRAPVIAINNPMLYFDLAKAVGADRNFTVLQNYNPSEPQKLAYQPMEEIAAEYVRGIREIQPTGPYTFVGLCAAGIIALEVAQQLKRAGETISLLVMADCYEPRVDRALNAFDRLRVYLTERTHDLQLRYKRWRRGDTTLTGFIGSWRIVRISGILSLAKALGLIDHIPEHHAVDDARVRWFLPHLLNARKRYVVQPYDGDIILLRSDEVPRNNPLFPADFGWTGLINGKMDVLDVPGFHMTLFKSVGASIIAEAMAPYLERADKMAAARKG